MKQMVPIHNYDTQDLRTFIAFQFAHHNRAGQKWTYLINFQLVLNDICESPGFVIFSLVGSIYVFMQIDIISNVYS